MSPGHSHMTVAQPLQHWSKESLWQSWTRGRAMNRYNHTFLVHNVSCVLSIIATRLLLLLLWASWLPSSGILDTTSLKANIIIKIILNPEIILNPKITAATYPVQYGFWQLDVGSSMQQLFTWAIVLQKRGWYMYIMRNYSSENLELRSFFLFFFLCSVIN